MPKGTPTIQPAKTTEYTTPEDLFDELSAEVDGFDMDPFCRPHHYTAQRVLENGGTICVPSASTYTGSSWLSALPYADPSRVLADGLAQAWHGKVYMNPPYGPALRQWVPKAVHEVECGNAELVMALLPAKTEVQWFQKYVMRMAYRNGPYGSNTFVGGTIASARQVRFLPGRLHFGGGDGPARVGSIIVVWRK